MGRIGGAIEQAFQIAENFDMGEIGRVAGGLGRVAGEAGRVADEFGRVARPGEELGRPPDGGGRLVQKGGDGPNPGGVFADTLISAFNSVGAGIAGLSEAGISALGRAFEPIGLNLGNLAASTGGHGPLGALASLPDPAASLGHAELQGGRRFQEVSEHLQNPQLDLHGLLGEARESLSNLGESLSGPLSGLRDLLGEITQDSARLGEQLRAAQRRG